MLGTLKKILIGIILIASGNATAGAQLNTVPSSSSVWYYQDFKGEKRAQQNAIALRSLKLGDVKVEHLSIPEPTICWHSIDETGAYGNYQCTYPEGEWFRVKIGPYYGEDKERAMKFIFGYLPYELRPGA
jgi:hypothetical protein